MSGTESDAGQTSLIGSSASVELSANRTSLSFERTRMSADRTLMSIVRTSLSLISFGFTLFETFHQLELSGVLADTGGTARRLGIALLTLGILMLVMGIWSHARFGRQLSERRRRLFGIHLLHKAIQYRATPTFVVATLLLVIGVAALASTTLRIASPP